MKLSVTILKYSFLLLLAHLALSWVFQFSDWNVPQTMPYTPIKINGLLITAFTLLILRFSLKEIINAFPEFKILKLTLLGLLICSIATIVFQIILSFTNEVDKLYYFLRGVAVNVIFGGVFAFFVAFQLKTKRTNQLIMFIVGFMIAFRIVLYFFPVVAKN